LGLAIARGLVEAHGGSLFVKSEEGQGAVVEFTVPALEGYR
jgi:signal transduction histidine kinase